MSEIVGEYRRTRCIHNTLRRASRVAKFNYQIVYGQMFFLLLFMCVRQQTLLDRVSTNVLVCMRV